MHIALSDGDQEVLSELYDIYEEWDLEMRFDYGVYEHDHHYWEAIGRRCECARIWMAAGNIAPDWYQC